MLMNLLLNKRSKKMAIIIGYRERILRAVMARVVCCIIITGWIALFMACSDGGSNSSSDSDSQENRTANSIAVDIDGDGVFDGVLVDGDGDGILDGVDTDDDGQPNQTMDELAGAFLDLDSDGSFSGAMDGVLVDVEGDGTVDGLDIDDDGAVDIGIGYIEDISDGSISDEGAVDNDSEYLNIGYQSGDSNSSVIGNLTLPTTGPNGTTIIWTSDNGAIVIDSDGTTTVTRPAFGSGDVTVTLTTTITKSGMSETKTFTLIVFEEFPAVAGVPLSPSSSSPNNETITVAWGSAADVDSYNIYWGTSSSVTTTSGTKIADVTSPYEHTGLSLGTDYYYIVTAVSSSGRENQPSAETTAYPYFSPQITSLTQCWDNSGSVVSCTGTGQDGEYQKGREVDFTGPIDTGGGEYITVDNVTGTIWMTCPSGQSGADCSIGGSPTLLNYEETIMWGGATIPPCQAASWAGYGGYPSWDISTYEVLETLIDYSNAGSPMTFESYFPGTSDAYSYWVLGTNPAGSQGWTVDFYSGGRVLKTVTDVHYGHCARATYNFLPVLPTNNGDGTVTDKGAGLTWQKCTAGQTEGTGDCQGTGTSGDNYGANSSMINWTDALTYCNNLSLSGKTWRLPNINELKSITDFFYENPALDTSAFPTTLNNIYWSSTTFVRSPVETWVIEFSDGRRETSNKGNLNYVRCVSDP